MPAKVIWKETTYVLGVSPFMWKVLALEIAALAASIGVIKLSHVMEERHILHVPWKRLWRRGHNDTG
jgi:hypothetical protein